VLSAAQEDVCSVVLRLALFGFLNVLSSLNEKKHNASVIEK
jgi:hypothetical protein